MAISTLSYQEQQLVVDNITDIVVTEIAQDAEAGDYVRDIRILGDNSRLVLQVRCRATTLDGLQIAIPAQEV